MIDYIKIKDRKEKKCPSLDGIVCSNSSPSSLRRYTHWKNPGVVTWTGLQVSISQLIDASGLDDLDIAVRKIRIDVDIDLPIDAGDFLINNVVGYKSKTSENEYWRYFDMRRYKVDLSVRGYKANRVKFSITVNSSVLLQKYGISTVRDLRDIDKVANLSKLLVKTWRGVVLSGYGAGFQALLESAIQKSWQNRLES